MLGHLVVHRQVPLLLIDRLLHSVLDRQFPLILDSVEVGISLLCKFEIGKHNFSHSVESDWQSGAPSVLKEN